MINLQKRQNYVKYAMTNPVLCIEENQSLEQIDWDDYFSNSFQQKIDAVEDFLISVSLDADTVTENQYTTHEPLEQLIAEDRIIFDDEIDDPHFKEEEDMKFQQQIDIRLLTEHNVRLKFSA